MEVKPSEVTLLSLEPAAAQGLEGHPLEMRRKSSHLAKPFDLLRLPFTANSLRSLLRVAPHCGWGLQ